MLTLMKCYVDVTIESVALILEDCFDTLGLSIRVKTDTFTGCFDTLHFFFENYRPLMWV